MWHAWRRGEVYTGVGWGNMKNRYHVENAGLDRTVILNGYRRNRMGCVNWIDLIQDKDRCMYVVNAVMELWVLGNARNFLTG
jgi:hypothetical protein